MPRPVQAQGRPGTPVVPQMAGVQSAADRTRSAAASLRHPGTTQTYSDELEQNVETPLAAYWTGTVRVQSLYTQARPVVVVGDREVVAQYLVTAPVAVVPDELDLVTLTDSGDPALDGRTLTVLQVVRGSLPVERDLFCTLDV